MSEESSPKPKWRVFAGVPGEEHAHLMCAFLRSAGLHPVIETSNALSHYGISSVAGCRVLLPEEEHGLALEAYAKVVVMPPNSAETAFESAEARPHPRSTSEDDEDEDCDLDDAASEWRAADPDAWKHELERVRESNESNEPVLEVVPDTGSTDADDLLDIPREQWTQRERDADDAFDLVRVGVFGVLAMPQVLYLLLCVYRSSERLRPSLRSKAVRAAWLGIPLFVLYFVVIPGLYFWTTFVGF